MFGPTEWIVIGGIIFLLFGAQKLPEFAKALGQSARELRKAAHEVSNTDPGHHNAGDGESNGA